MSLLEEILSSIKRESPSGDVPPNLKRIVASSMAKQRTRRRTILLSIFALIMVGIGYGAILFFEKAPSHVLKQDDSKKVLQALQGLKAVETLQTSSVQPAATITSPQSPPLPPTQSVERPPPVHESAAGSLEDGKSPGGLRQDRTRRPSDTPQNSPKVIEGELAAAAKEPARDGRQSPVLKRSPGTADRQQAREIIRIDATPVGKTEKDLHLYTAKSYEAAGDFGKALTEYKKALEWDRENHLILNNMAGVLIRLGLYKDAGAFAEKALVVRKDYVPSLVNLAVARLKSGESEEGMKYLFRALQLAPTDGATLSNLALLCEKTGEYAKSYDLYRRLAAMDDIDGHLGMARVCEKENRVKEAEAIYWNILKRDPDRKTKKLASERLAALGSKE